MEDWEKARVDRLRAALDKPVAEDRESETVDHFDPWHDVMTGITSAYNSELDHLAIDVLKAVRDGAHGEILKSDRGLAAELFMHILSDQLGDYGTSP